MVPTPPLARARGPVAHLTAAHRHLPGVACGPTMAIGIIHLLSVLGLLQLALKVGDQPDKVTQDLLQEREKMLREEMSWLLQEVEEGSELESEKSTLFVFLAACHHWQFWALAETLLILFGMYWLPRQRQADTNGDSDPRSSTSVDGDVGEEEDEKVEDELMEEQEEWEEVHFYHQHLLVGLLRESLLPNLLEMENIMEEMAGTHSASANSLQRSPFMFELQAEMGLLATVYENNLATFHPSFAPRTNSMALLQASTEEYLQKLDT
ncbi:uncharacterized protein [Anser cygnoides]|uniref:uncharacterized protein isoform X1 n=1 Tax=Anser cygnoides TaxID=8845 RepID=UPI0034D1D458